MRLWVALGLVLLLCAGIVGWIVVRRGDAGGRFFTPSVSATERKIVGTWDEVEVEGALRIEATTTFSANHTFRGEVTILTLFGEKAFGIKVSGKWHVQDDLLVSTIETEDWDHGAAPDLHLNKLFPGLKLAGQTVSEQIVSVSDTHLITKDPSTGKTTTATRKR